jgi:prepilin signal peptidase PulO-like enzyme (type II secretory pathway)
VDAVEGRIPTPVAHGTTAISLVALSGHAMATGDWRTVLWAVALTTMLVLGLGMLWLARGIGFGDVRLAAALVTAMTSGVQGLTVVVYSAFLLAGAAVVLRRLRGRRGDIPFGPALAMGWVLAVAAG